MSSPSTAPRPRRWTKEEFQDARDTSLAQFRIERMSEPLEFYADSYENRRDAFDELVEKTVDLTLLRDMAVEVLADPSLLEVVRYVAGPPVSADDLKNLAEASLARARLVADPKMAQRIVDTVMLGLDSRRFPWIKEDRAPTEAEREIAAVATSALIASQRVRTQRSTEGGSMLERFIAARLVNDRFEQVASRTINTTDDAPQVGQFCGESMFGSRKADLVVRLFDKRILAIECKVSNSETNSIKRLNNDAAQKATVWLREFGALTAVPAAALSGVFKVKNLIDAQSAGLAIFWEHDLDAMMQFIESTRVK